MASSKSRKKQNRAKAAAKHAEERRRRAATARIRAVQARLSRIYHPETSAAELAILLGEHYQGVPVAGWLASALLREAHPWHGFKMPPNGCCPARTRPR